MKVLLKQTEKFAALVDSPNVAVVKNHDQLLSEMGGLKTFKQRVEFARENWEELGEGSSRTVFKLSPSLIIKIAHNPKGIQQNLVEMRLNLQRPCINGILVADPDGRWLIMRFTDKVSEKQWEQIVGIPFETFMAGLMYRFNNERHTGKPRNYDELIEHPLFKCLSNLFLTSDPLQLGDIAKLSSWGLCDGEVKLRDFGLSKELFRRYYEGKDGNSTSSPEPASSDS